MSYRDHSRRFRSLGVTAEISQARETRSANWAVCFGAGLLAMLTLSACGPQAPQLVLTKPITRDTVRTRTYACRIHSPQNIEIHAPDRGYLEVVNVKEGQHLKKGELMFKILPQTYNAELKLAQAEAQEAKTDYDNAESLLKTHAASDKEVSAAKAKWDQKLAKLKLTQTHPKFTLINAPFNGLMSRIRLGVGSLVNAGDVLTTLSDNNEMWVDFKVPQAHYAEYSASMSDEELPQVQLMLANGMMFDQPGRLTRLAATAEPTTGTTTCRAVFPNPKDLLRHGGTGNIIMQKTIKNALLVPRHSTFEIQDHYYLYVVDKDHVIRQQRISITQELDNFFVVTEGVNENDTIVFKGVPRVHDGETAKNYQFEEPAVAYAHLKFTAD